MLQSGISFRLINWPGDAASRKGPRIAQAADAVLVASPSARPDLFYQEPAFTAAMTFDFARRFRPIAAQDALFQWFANATLDDFRSADLVQLRAIALGFGLGDDRGDGFVFFDSEGLVFPTTERVAAARRDHDLAQRHFDFEFDMPASRSGRMSAKFWRATPSR
jgi:hypothetical protein